MSKLRAPLRHRRFDDLGLRRAMADRLLPMLVGAMAFLAALALAGVVAADSLARHWQQGAASVLTVQVPHPDQPDAKNAGTRLAAVLAALRADPHVADAHALSQTELTELLRPWLGDGVDQTALPLPAVITVHLHDRPAGPDSQTTTGLAATLAALAPETATESGTDWGGRLAVLARSLQASAGLVLLVVAFVALAVVTVAVRAGLSARRDSIEIVHGLGATDGYIARRFAARAGLLAGAGAAIGTVAALPVLLGLAGLAAPLVGSVAQAGHLPDLSPSLWVSLPLLPVIAAVLGWGSAQRTVRLWLRRLS